MAKRRLLLSAGRVLEFDRPAVMAILNITPDSFSDGGRFYANGKFELGHVAETAAQLIKQGADILDVGGESTRPGAAVVSSQQEIDRVLPVLEQLQSMDVLVSLDTSNPELIAAAAGYGVAMVNDVRALQRPGAIEAVAATDMAVCLMHMQGQPQTMQDAPNYVSVLHEVAAFLSSRVKACVDAGIELERICLDPGFGFGKTLENNLDLLLGLQGISELSRPILVGMSRKSMITQMLGCELDQRLAGSLALAMAACERGADIIRVHDVQETADIVAVYQALQHRKDEYLNE